MFRPDYCNSYPTPGLKLLLTSVAPKIQTSSIGKEVIGNVEISRPWKLLLTLIVFVLTNKKRSKIMIRNNFYNKIKTYNRRNSQRRTQTPSKPLFRQKDDNIAQQCNSTFIYHYYSFKIFPQFWLAKSTRIIHHNQLLMTKFGRILCLTRKWRQKCSLLQVNAPLTEKTWDEVELFSFWKLKWRTLHSFQD